MNTYKKVAQKNTGFDVSHPLDALNHISDRYNLEWNDNSKLILVCNFLYEINGNPERFLNYLTQQAEQETKPVPIF